MPLFCLITPLSLGYPIGMCSWFFMWYWYGVQLFANNCSNEWSGSQLFANICSNERCDSQLFAI